MSDSIRKNPDRLWLCGTQGGNGQLEKVFSYLFQGIHIKVRAHLDASPTQGVARPSRLQSHSSVRSLRAEQGAFSEVPLAVRSSRSFFNDSNWVILYQGYRSAQSTGFRADMESLAKQKNFELISVTDAKNLQNFIIGAWK